MSITGYDSQRIRSQVKVDTIHHRTQLILRSGKYRTVYVGSQHARINRDYIDILWHRQHLGIFCSAHDGKVIFTALIYHLDCSQFGINDYIQRLLGQLSHSVKHGLALNGKSPFSRITVQCHSRLHHVFAVRRSNRQRTIVHLKQETFQYRE